MTDYSFQQVRANGEQAWTHLAKMPDGRALLATVHREGGQTTATVAAVRE